MPSLLLVVFVLQLLIHLVNNVGAPVINEFVRSPSTPALGSTLHAPNSYLLCL